MKMLNQPLKIGKVRLTSRLVMAPMETRKAVNDLVSQELCEYYDEKSRGGYLGLVVTEHCYVSEEGQASRNQLSIANDVCVEGLGRIADVIHHNGVAVIAQISHAGSKAKRELTGREPISPSTVQVPGEDKADIELPKEMTAEEIGRIISCFADAADRAKRAGYDGVELHSAHGYLLNQFYSPLTNKRSDEYSGYDITGRLKLHVQIIEEIRRRTGEDFLISVRLGACDYMEGGSTKKDAAEAGRILEKAGADLLSISGGMCGYLRQGHTEAGWFAEAAEAVKGSISIPVLLTGGVKSGSEAEALLKSGKADLIGIGRAILRDSMLPEKMIKNG